MFFVFSLDTGAATNGVLETTSLETDHVEVFVGMEAILGTFEIGNVLFEWGLHR